MKLIFFPMLVFAVFEGFALKGRYKNFWCVKFLGTVIGTLLVPVLFYTINGSLGKTPDFVNITIFFLSAFFAYVIETRLLENNLPNCKRRVVYIILLVLISLCFAYFTNNPPELPIFLDPVSGMYGI